MKTTEVKTSELVGAALDWAVAKSEGDNCNPAWWSHHSCSFRPSTDWAGGGPLIDVHQIEFSFNDDTDIVRASMFCWRSYGKSHRTRWNSGETHLIAACRAIVAAKLGDVVSVPSELLEQTK